MGIALDTSLRQQFVTERVKRGRDEFTSDTAGKLARAIESKLAKYGDTSLGDLTKAQYNSLLMGVRKEVGLITSDFAGDSADFLQAYSGVEHALANTVYGGLSKTAKKATLHGPAAAEDAERAWSKIVNALVPANGLTIDQSLGSFRTYADATVTKALAMARANNETAAQALSSVVGTSDARYLNGALTKLSNNMRALSNTLIQHVAQNTDAAVMSTYFARYEWIALVDSRTTAICMSRDGNVYEWGKGPLPPAHYGCRSTISIFDRSEQQNYNDLDAWIAEQSQDFRDSMDTPLSLDGLAKLVADAAPLPEPVAEPAPVEPPAPAPEPVTEPEPAAKAPRVRAPDFKARGVSLDGGGDTRGTIQTYRAIMGDLAPAELRDALIGDVEGVSAEQSDMEVSSPGYGRITLSTTLRDEDGIQVGTMSRTFAKPGSDALTVQHTSFYLADDVQGSDIGKDILANSMAKYEELGVSRVSLTAGSEVGGYAWARYGFVPGDDAWANLKLTLRDRLASIDLPTAERDAVNATLARTDGAAIRDIADLTFDVDGQKLGPKLLLGTTWTGGINLADEITMGRFNAYVTR